MTPPSLRNQATPRTVRRDDPGRGPQTDRSTTEESDPPASERLAASDRDAFEKLFRRLSEPVFRYVAGMVDDESDARDVTQEVFARLWSVRKTLSGVDSLSAYLFRMARNEVYDRRRAQETRRERRARLGTGGRGASPASAEDSLDARHLRKLLDRWIGELPARQREALLLSRREELSHEEVAEVMDISPNTVNNHVVRALKHLRRRARDERPDLLS